MGQNYLYGLTVQGIQSYIFETNKLKEIIGASEIIEQLCSTWFDKFLEEEKLTGVIHLNAAGNIRFLTDEITAKIIFEEYHFTLLEKAPGVPFCQAVVKIEGGKEYEANQELDKKLRGQRNVPLYETDLGLMTRSKFRRTGSFSVNIEKDLDTKDYFDNVTSVKHTHSTETVLSQKVSINGYDLTYPSEFKEIAKDSKHNWLAVVHIDGNGMGLIIKDILDNSENKFTDLQDFSTKIGKCTFAAFKTAIEEVLISKDEQAKKDEQNPNKITLPIRPIIIGGDDVTLIIRADLALKFTRVYLEIFEKKTKTAELNNKQGVTACAGIAYVKEKFPFHYSVNLAEELCTYAKNESKRKASCVQFHKVQDSIIDNYKEIEQRELTVNNFIFQNGPYYLDNYTDKNKISDLVNEVKTLKQDDSPKNGIREWIDAKFNNPAMAKTLIERLENKTKKEEYKEILKKEKSFMDYHTLLAVNTKTN
ncbi:hypothetical protein Lupro_02520 [Lutibacter profundi]|uniref:Cas10/Cmr2 second palm domain-containing protein n=1 Tax=Lutibacter profundi TaxID=1622118 RepID=A0A0X8G5V7_9FLAO|nr:hypothetical protein [Lutibacter profundi]AMC10193.1 hypothetical protein Lupro_02520 [Lutibacter profundi]